MNKLQSFIQEQNDNYGGFLRQSDMPALIALDRLCQVLVRCGGCRFTCAAQDVAHLIKCVDAGGDYVRDVSFPVGSMERAASWQPDCPVTPLSAIPASFLAPRHTAGERAKARNLSDSVWFNEADCSGAFDGFQVTSDADPGL